MLVLGKWQTFSPNIKGIFLSIQVLKHPDKKFRIGQALKATVVGPDSSKAFLCLSLIGVVKNAAWSEKGEGRKDWERVIR